MERTRGSEEVGVVGFKKELYEKALEKLGDFEQETFYVVVTFLDQRYILLGRSLSLYSYVKGGFVHKLFF